MRAAELFEQGRSNAEIARVLGVSDESVRRWKRVWEEGGTDALRRRPATGRPPKLDAQVERVRTALEQGAQAHGFEADLWTLERVGLVVERVTGVPLSQATVWRLLTGRLGWSLQRPEPSATTPPTPNAVRACAFTSSPAATTPPPSSRKHEAEQRAAAEAARKRAEEAAKQKQRPEDDAKNDKAELPGSKGCGGDDGSSGGGCPPGKQTWCDWAGYLGETSTWTGWGAAAANLIPAPGVAQGVSAVAGGISLLSGVGSSIFTGVAYGFGSDEFWGSALGTTIGFVGGKFKSAVSKGAGLVKSGGTKAKEVFGDAAGSISSGVTGLFG
ncbi:helix-turn-helix domain-containing protein [Streptomyces chrestomyceticus]|uniref:helix-turn-helix domain-containing protein n=1 Tax=Streptomyces chrestomyceticus TaxID=68185 RepID=UPI0033D4B941